MVIIWLLLWPAPPLILPSISNTGLISIFTLARCHAHLTKSVHQCQRSQLSRLWIHHARLPWKAYTVPEKACTHLMRSWKKKRRIKWKLHRPTTRYSKQQFESCKTPYQVGLNCSVAHCYTDHIIASTDHCRFASVWGLCFTAAPKWQASVSGSS